MRAFPHEKFNEPGMDLRDWFAGQALMSMLSHPSTYVSDNQKLNVAMQAYKYADAMMKARSKC